MKIYTKKGDKGKTSLLRGVRVTKADLRIEAYGTVDELNAFIGHLCDQHKNQKTILFEIQKTLFNIGSILSSDKEESQINLPEITNDNIKILENEIDKMEAELPHLKDFILPSGHSLSSFCHITRTVCRRAERRVVALDLNTVKFLKCVQYLNRLSDYLFVLSRLILKENNIKENTWK
jgi:cob(I)alamin adenosyltransferase